MKVARRIGVLSILACLALAAPASADFSIVGLDASTTSSQAGAHPDLTTSLVFATLAEAGGGAVADGNVRSLAIQLPAGLQGSPSAIPRCGQREFAELACTAEAQVGWIEASLIAPNGAPTEVGVPVFNLQPGNDGITAEIGFSISESFNHLQIAVRSDGDYGLTVADGGISRAFAVTAFQLTIWGVPGDPSHDSQRYDMEGNAIDPGPLPRVPFFTNPTSCGGTLTLHAEATSYQDPGGAVEAEATLPPISGCGEVKFAPRLRARPTTNLADSPSGLDLDLAIPQSLDPYGLASAQLRQVVLTLPEGLLVNPAGANGLEACSPEQIGLKSTVGDPAASFDLQPPACPPASRLGSVEIETPILADPLTGSVNLATPHQNPFGSLLAVYLSIQGHGLEVKLAGKVETDPGTGRITAVFPESPQLPVEHLRLHLFNGSLAPLRTPAVCGTYASTSSLTPWSAPASGPPATPKDEYAIVRAADGGSCSRSEAELPSSPSFEAGSTAPLAGRFLPFVVNLSREDGTRQFGAVTITPPPGLLAKLAGTESCPDLALALAAGRSGEAEEASPSCPAGSEVGHVVLQAGAGPEPYTVTADTYLAGPYKGAPLSLAIVTPAVAGPFDLGTVVVRVALYLDPQRAQVTARSDPIPSILQGIPLDIRSASLRLDRPGFTLNPTNCDPGGVEGSLVSTSGAATSLTSHFQVSDCRRLRFKPRLRLQVLSGSARNAHPALRVVLRSTHGEANIAAATIALPPGPLLDLRNVAALCPSNLPAERCPRASRLGRARVWSPLLDAPMRGPIYLREPGRRYPELLADLHGPFGLRFSLRGSFEAASGKVGVRFSELPDMPIEKAMLTLAGGRRGVLVNSRSLCAESGQGRGSFLAHDDRRELRRPKLRLKAGC